MHVEIKVAQNFVLNFLYNKLPRRRVNLFGEELDSALRDKFADHWYPDKPFKGSAFRCLKITDPADPVLNRAARESGNPIPDITDNLPTDLAIWIDPGEVSYRIGEKGSVKILFSANDTGNFSMSGGGHSGTLAVEELNNEPENGPMHGNIGTSNSYLPIENLSATMNTLSLNAGGNTNGQLRSPVNHLQSNAHESGPPLLSQQNLTNNMNQPNPPTLMTVTGNNGGGNIGAPVTNGQTSSNGGTNGFTPFTPRQHQTVTYTAGTFAQTKFGSTKLKSSGKKTNRMSPTEFSNYIKQRAMQKQGSSAMSTSGIVNGGGMQQINNPTNGSNGGAGSQFRSQSINNGASLSSTNNFRPITSNGFYSNQQQHQNYNGFNCALPEGGGKMQQPLMSQQQQQQQQQTSPDSFFYPLFPDRGRQQQQQSTPHSGNQNSLSTMSNSATNSSTQQSNLFQQGGSAGSVSSAGSSNGSSSASSTSSNNPWSYIDTEAENVLQDILSVGLSSNKQSRNTYSDFSANGENNCFGGSNPSSFGFGTNHFSGNNSSVGNVGSNNSLGLSGNFGAFGNLNIGAPGNNHSAFNGSGQTGSALYGSPADESVSGQNIKMVDRIGSNSMSPAVGAQ